jgi:hypothetical protein
MPEEVSTDPQEEVGLSTVLVNSCCISGEWIPPRRGVAVAGTVELHVLYEPKAAVAFSPQFVACDAWD